MRARAKRRWDVSMKPDEFSIHLLGTDFGKINDIPRRTRRQHLKGFKIPAVGTVTTPEVQDTGGGPRPVTKRQSEESKVVDQSLDGLSRQNGNLRNLSIPSCDMTLCLL